MNFDSKSVLCKALRDESGQALPWFALMLVMFMGIMAMVMDVGRGVIAYREIQASTMAAALASGYSLPSADYNCIGLKYSSSSNSAAGTGANANCAAYTGANVHPDLQNVVTTVTPRCSSTLAGSGWNLTCQNIGTSTKTANVVTVTQTASIPTYFAWVFGIDTLNVGATAYGSAKGAGAQAWNVAIIVDTTSSMNTQDTNCGTVPGYTGRGEPTRLHCELWAVQQLLQDLKPCPDSFTTCPASGSAAVNVSLWTFPNPTTATVGNDTNCSGTNPTIQPYTFPSSLPTATNYSPGTYISATTTGTGRNQKTTYTTYNTTYAVTTTGSGSSSTPSYTNGYRSSGTDTSLNSGVGVVQAVGGQSGCTGVSAPGGESTYYAAVLYAAQASLLAQQASELPAVQSQNAIILFSDGDAEAGSGNMVNTASQTCSGCLVATSSGTYPSWKNECQQAITAASTIAGQGTRIYTVAYGSESSGCSTDSPRLAPCSAMEQMNSGWSQPANNPANADTYFYSDANQSGSGSNCYSGTNKAVTDLPSIVLAISQSLELARLVPSSVATN